MTEFIEVEIRNPRRDHRCDPQSCDHHQRAEEKHSESGEVQMMGAERALGRFDVGHVVLQVHARARRSPCFARTSERANSITARVWATPLLATMSGVTINAVALTSRPSTPTGNCPAVRYAI